MAGEDPTPSGMAGRYATALFELALEEKAIDKVRADVDRFDGLLAESADLLRMVRSPVFTADEQTKRADRHAEPGRHRRACGEIHSVRGAQAAPCSPCATMTRAYRALVARHKGEVTGACHRRQDAPEAHLSALMDALKSVTKQDVQLDLKVDPAIIGGLTVKLGSRMVNSSLRTKLNSIKFAMKEAR